MITIIVDTRDEYDKMLESAEEYVCRQMPNDMCLGFKTRRCEDCYEQFHNKYGIKVVFSTSNNV